MDTTPFSLLYLSYQLGALAGIIADVHCAIAPTRVRSRLV
jgi:hypothetical protein